MKDKRKYIKWLLLLFIFIGGLLIQNMFNVKRNKEFPRTEKEDKVIGRIINLKIIKGTCYVELIDSKIRISSSQNYQYHSEYIQNNIFIGDSIVKKSGSDTIRIISGNKEYLFVHGKVINEHLRWKNH
ncbi:MAG: hypothetical protein ACERIH_04660 [Labilibaculum antarcticum]